MESVNAQLTKKMAEEKRLARRESDLVEHVSRLEAQLQEMMTAKEKETEQRPSKGVEQPEVATSTFSEEDAAELKELRSAEAELRLALAEADKERRDLKDRLAIMVRTELNAFVTREE